MLDYALYLIIQNKKIDEIIDIISERNTISDVNKFKKKITVYIDVFNELKKVGKICENKGYEYDISLKPKLSFHFGWECKIKGLWVNIFKNKHFNSILYALPIVELKTNTYGPYFLGGVLPAADLLRVTDKLLLFVSQENTPHSELLKEISIKRKPVHDLLPICNVVQQGALIDVELEDPACVDTPVGPSKNEILNEVFNNLSDIQAVGIVHSGIPFKEIIPREKIFE